MPNLYLKHDNPQGQAFGLRDEHHQIRQIGRFFPHKPTHIEDRKTALRLLKTYPRHLGDWDKDEEKVRAILAQRREAVRQKQADLMVQRNTTRGPAQMAQFAPAKPKPQTPAEDPELVPEEELTNRIEMGEDAPLPDHEPNIEDEEPV